MKVDNETNNATYSTPISLIQINAEEKVMHVETKTFCHL
jgi:hypothetical protein